MKMNNKRTVWALLLLAVLCCALLAGCNGGDKGVSEIFVQKTDMPKATYVQGQELDLHGGVLTVVMDGATTPVPMDAADVAVTGYNKDQLGKQTLTVTYKGKTTTIDITVVARTIAEGYEVNYFVGDTYDNSKGKICINKDDGTKSYVNLNSAEVTLKSFDSSKAGQATITVAYGDYECAFQVTVHDVDSIQLTAPKQSKYASHEPALNLGGGYITVKAASPSTFSKHVPLTAEMVSGYDPSQMTYEKRDQVITQTITVSYGGQQASYDIEIAYSDVHLVQYLAQKLQHLDWSQEPLPEMSEEEMQNAMAAIETYLALTPLEKDYIDEATFQSVLFSGTMALRVKYLNEMATFADAFGITAEGQLVVVGKSYEAIAKAAERLANADDPFNTYAATMAKIKESYADIPFLEITVGDLTVMHTEEVAQSMVELFNYMLNLYDTLTVIPKEWTVQTLEENEMSVANAVSKIIIGKYQGLEYNSVYRSISSWRENDDYFDILYTFYTYIKPDGMEELQAGLWQTLPLPGMLNDWYVNFMRAVEMERFMLQYETSQAYLYDTAGFMYYYFQTQACAKAVLESGNQLHINIYNMLDFDGLFEANLRSGPRGYLYHMGEGLDSQNVQMAWDKLMVIIDIYLNKQGATYAEYETEFRAVFDQMVAMSPTELYAFVSSVNFLYDSSRGTVLVLECNNRTYSTMMTLVASFYASMMPEEVFPCFQNLILAMENYSLRGIKETAVADFNALMETVTAQYQALSQENKAIFDKYLGAGYSKYLTIYSRIAAGKQVDLGQQEATLEQLMATMQKFDELMGYALSSTVTPEEKNRTIPVAMALYEKACALHSQLMAMGGDVACELVTREYVIQEITLTPDFYFSAVRNLFTSFMVSAGITVNEEESYMLWDLYAESAVRPLMQRLVELLLAEYNGQVYQGTGVGYLMMAFRVLTPAEKNTFFILGINQVYYAALERYFCSANPELAAYVPALLRAEIAHAVYRHSQEDADLTSFLEAFELVLAEYEKLSNKDQLDTDLRQMYALYEQAYRDLKK